MTSGASASRPIPGDPPGLDPTEATTGSGDRLDETPPQVAPARETTYGDLRAVRGFFNLLGASISSKSAARTYQVVLVLFVLGTYHSARLSGLIVLTSQIPGILFSPFAGALLDRRNRVLLMSVDYLVAGSSVALVLGLSLAHHLPVSALFVIVGFASLTQPLSVVGSRSLFPAIVPRHLWDRSNGLDSTTYVVAAVLGPAIAGMGVATLGPRWALAIPVVLYLVAASSLVGVHAPAPTTEVRRSLTADALGAVRYVFSNKVLRQLALTMTFFNAATGVTTVAVPVLVLRHLHGGSMTTGLMISTLGMFGFLSSLSMGAFGTVGRERRLMCLACAIAALGLSICAASTHHEVLVFIGLAVTGLANGPMVVTMFTLRTRATDPEWFGRAFAVSMNVNSTGAPLAAAATGAIVSHSVVLAFACAAAVAFIAGLWPILFPFGTVDHHAREREIA